MSDEPHICPVCGSTEWYADYHLTGSGDEMRVDHCETCDWPPGTPMSLDEYRQFWQSDETDLGHWFAHRKQP